MELTKNEQVLNTGSHATFEDKSIKVNVQHTAPQTEELKTSETPAHPMALKKQGDSSKLRDMLIDTLTRFTGMIES
jgi:hypothetical protein